MNLLLCSQNLSGSSYSEAMSGGTLAAGAATFGLVDVPISATAGCAASGSALVFEANVPFISGGIWASAGATNSQVFASTVTPAGCLAGGAGAASIRIAILVVGSGVYGNGSAGIASVYGITGSGGVYDNGAAVTSELDYIIPSGGVYGSGSGGHGAICGITGSSGAYGSGLGSTTGVFNVLLSAGGDWVGGIGNTTATFNVNLSPAGNWASDPRDDQPTEFFATLLGESLVGLPCRVGLVLRYVTMIKIRNGYVPAITVCDSQLVLRRLRSRSR